MLGEWMAGMDNFTNYVEATEWQSAWDCLREVHGLLSTVKAPRRSMYHKRTADAMITFTMHCIQDWTISLKPQKTESVTHTLPGPTELKQLVTDLGLTTDSSWSAMLWHVTSDVVRHHARSADGGPQLLLVGIREAVGLWQMCLENSISVKRKPELNRNTEQGNDPARATTIEAPWDRLPSAEALANTARGLEGDDTLNGLLSSVFPRRKVTKDDSTTGKSNTFDYASPALATIYLLRVFSSYSQNGVNAPGLELLRIQPFIDFLEECLRLSRPVSAPPSLLKRMGPPRNDIGLYGPMLQRLDIAVDVAAMKATSVEHRSRSHEDAQAPALSAFNSIAEASEKDVEFSVPLTPEMAHFARSCIKRLAKAREQEKFSFAEQIKNEVLERANACANAELQPPPLELFEHLILTFLLLRRPEKAMEMWQRMIETGHQPTVRTYTVILRGARTSRDLTGMAAFWQRMRNAGIQPDIPAWTAWIYGLIKLRKPDDGIRVMTEMGKEWLDAARKQAALDRRAAGKSSKSSKSEPPPSVASLLATYPGAVRGVPRPDVTILNAALTALADTQDDKIPHVVKWARAFGIELDVITYNVLINIAMRHGQTENATALVARMKERNIAPDGNTWVVILTAMFQGGFLAGVEKDAQVDKIIAFVDSTKAADGSNTIDEKGFALIVNRLLKHHDNPEAVSQMLSYMLKNKIPLNVHIATMLLTHWFEQDPPNFAAIDNFWERIKDGDLREGSAIFVDTVFYDRLIEGYARFHREIGIRPCLDILYRAEREGRYPGWRALELVARALAERDEWDKLRDVVYNVRKRLDRAFGGTQRMGQREFWQFIIATGIEVPETIFRPDELLPRGGPRPSPLLASMKGDDGMW
jgi:pentatricopeptide repeat protein